MSSTVLFAANYLPSNTFLFGRSQFVWSPGSWQALRRCYMALRRDCTAWGRTRAPQTLPDANSEDFKMLQKSLDVSQNDHWYQRCLVFLGGLAMHHPQHRGEHRRARCCLGRDRGHSLATVSERSLLFQCLCSEVRTGFYSQQSHFYWISLSDE